MAVLMPMREAASWVCDSFRDSKRREAGLIKVPRGTLRYRPFRDPQVALRARLKELAASRVRYFYRRLRVLLKREGWKVYRLYGEESLRGNLETGFSGAVGTNLRGGSRPHRHASVRLTGLSGQSW